MPISAIDSLGPAFQHTKQQLIQPFRWSQWARLALVGMLAGELNSGGGCNTNFNVPAHTSRGSDHLLSVLPMPSLPTMHPALFIALIALLVIAGLVLSVLLLYVSSVFRFILFDSVLARHCEVRRHWTHRQVPGLRLFLFHLAVLAATLAGLIILIGIPAGFAFLLGWLQQPRQHMLPLILGGMVLFFLLMIFLLALALVHVLTKDFVVPQMALEEVSAFEAWRRLLPMLNGEKGGYAGYIGMKIVLALAAAIAIGIVATIVILIMMIPAALLGVLAVFGGKAAGLTWTAYTITLAVVVGAILLAIILYVVALISVPAIVFFPAYSIYFFAARYPRLDALLHPAPVVPTPYSAPSQPPPEPPPLPPSPEPIG